MLAGVARSIKEQRVTRKKERRILIVIGFLFVIPMMGLPAWVAYGTADSAIVTVTKTENSGRGGDQKYLIYTTTETFENTDSVWYWKFNSSDIHGQITPGRHVVNVYGWRVPLLSKYRNVVSFQRLE